jgi:DNA-binding response OmpR family regulator
MVRNDNSKKLVLILEDQVLIGINLQDELQDAGYQVAGPFATCAAALAWLQTSTPDVAILDAALKDGPCQEVALALGKRAVPFLIYSGFSADRELIADFASVTWVEKPAPPAALVRACHQLLVSEG